MTFTLPEQQKDPWEDSPRHEFPVTYGVTNERLRMVCADSGDSRLVADLYDPKGRWLQRWEHVTKPELDELCRYIEGEIPRSKLNLRRTTLVLRALWSQDDTVGDYYPRRGVVSLDELTEEAYSHESFLLSNGMFGEPANFSTVPLVQRCRLPAERWATHESVGLCLRGVDFEGACLQDADLRHCDIRDSNFNACDLRGADLRGLDLSGCDFRGADLSNADLRETRGLVLDDCKILGAQFSPNHFWIGRRIAGLVSILGRLSRKSPGLQALSTRGEARVPSQDPWSTLRRSYTGPMMLVHLSLLLAYISPMVAKSLFWSEVNQAQNLISIGRRSLETGALSPCLAPECTDPMPIGLVLLGVQNGWYSALFGLLLLLYNLNRAFLTYRVSLLRDEEERCSMSPAKDAYLRLFWFHRMNSAILIPILLHLGERAWNFLALTTVSLPSPTGMN